MAKKDDDSKVFIGRKKSINYVMAAMVVLNDKPVNYSLGGDQFLEQ